MYCEICGRMEISGMIKTIDSVVKYQNSTNSVQPSAGECYDFFSHGYNAKKYTWLIPHLVKPREDSEIITWRCNWGSTCESTCLYAMNKNSIVYDNNH